MSLVGIARHIQSTQNNKFARSLKIFQKEVRDEVVLLHTLKHQTFLKVDTSNIGGHSLSCLKYPK